jgi:transcriptional regulator with XRE-family HTH domain
MSLAAKLRTMRVKKGESLQDVADAIGVSKTHIWQLEKGHSKNPSVDLLTKLADHFKVTVASLSGEDPEATGEDALVMRMFRQVGELEEHDKATLDDMIQSMLKRKRERDASDRSDGD